VSTSASVMCEVESTIIRKPVALLLDMRMVSLELISHEDREGVSLAEINT
jgi:hypothetical protein